MKSLMILSGWLLAMQSVAAAENGAATPSFESEVGPLLARACQGCHGDKRKENGLDLTSREALIRGGKTGSAMLPGSLRESLLWTVIATDRMPADGPKLSSQEKDTLRRWILAEAPQSDLDAAKVAARTEQTAGLDTETVRGVDALATRIDELISERMIATDIEPSVLADDAEFLRRVYLDLNGRVPNNDETRNFLARSSGRRRADLIEERLADEEFGRHMAIRWHRLLIPKSAGAYARIPHRRFREWLTGQFNAGRGWDAIVAELITAEGYLPSNKDNELSRKKDAKLQPQNIATAFINVHNTDGRPQPKGIIASVSRLFLAQSIECAQCHNHPQAKWEQSDFWGAAAFFERVRYDRAVYGDTSIGRLSEPAEGKELVYEDKAKARYSFVPAIRPEPVIALQDANGQPAGEKIRAKFLDGPEPELDPLKSYRDVFAEWATSRNNPYFARALVNRVWSQLMGRGFVEPVDDMSEDNRPSHPRLLDELSAEFAASGFDVAHLMRCICNSSAYQRSSVPAAEPADPALFAHQSLKQMTAEQLVASLETVLPTFAAWLEEDRRDKNPGLMLKEFLEVHETDDSQATEHTRGLQQALRMMNGDGKLLNREALSKIVSDQQSVDENVRRVYLVALNRNPTETELTQMVSYVETATEEISQIDPKRLPQQRNDRPDSRPDPYADVLWVLINSGEFIFNH